MASSTKPFYLTPPHGGINTESSPTLIDDNEAVDLVNMLVHEPGQMRPRNGYDGSFSVSSWATVNTRRPVGYIAAPDPTTGQFGGFANWTALLSWATTPTLGLYYGRNSTQSGTYNLRILYGDASGVTSTNVAFPSGLYPLDTTFAIGPGAILYGANYFTCLGQVNAWGGSAEAVASRTVNMTAGSKSGTFSVAPANSLAGQFIIDNSVSVNGVSYSLSYQITEHSGGATAFTTLHPYGMGIPDWTANLAAARNVSPLALISGAGLTGDEVVTFAHQERIFASDIRGDVRWSQPTTPFVWSTNNYITTGGGAVLAGYSTGRELLMFKADEMWMLQGDSEANYSLRKVYDDVGCLGAHALTTWRNNVIVCNYEGVWLIDANLGVTDLTSPTEGKGIREDWRSWLGSTWAQSSQHLFSAAVMEDYLLITKMTNADPTDDMWACYLPSQSWVKFGNSAHTFNLRPELLIPNFSSLASPKVQGAFGNIRSIASLDNMVRDESLGTTQDVVIGSSTLTYNIPATVEFKHHRVAGGDTFRVSHTWIEHCMNYVNATTITQPSFNLYFSSDPNLDAGSESLVSAVPPRRETSATYAYNKFYTDEINADAGSSGFYGSVIRVKLTTNLATHAAFPKSRKWFRIRLDVTPGRSGRIDTPVL